jgi:hypothetical protein
MEWYFTLYFLLILTFKFRLKVRGKDFSAVSCKTIMLHCFGPILISVSIMIPVGSYFMENVLRQLLL